MLERKLVLRLLVLCPMLLGLSFPGTLSAEEVAAPVAPQETPEKKKEEAPEEKVRTGTIAEKGNYHNNVAIDAQTGGATPGDESGIISGSVNKGRRGECLAVVTNGSEVNAYSVTFNVIGVNDRGSKVVNKNFSASLKPKESVQRSVPCNPEYKMSVVLNSAKKR